MNGYKNAPHIKPKIGDRVRCGLPGDTALVASIAEASEADPRPALVNCAVDGDLHLNRPMEAMLVISVDGKTPNVLLK